MFIKSLRVDEGFFDGLHLEFAKGLNVLIGGRGVGKTSVIELLRFGLGAGGLTETAASEAVTHAVSVLQSGKVFIEIESEGRSFEVCRASDDSSPITNGEFEAPIVFSQTEIESIGLDAVGRLELLDTFVRNERSRDTAYAHAVASVRSHASALLETKREIEVLQENLPKRADLTREENVLIGKQKEHEKSNAGVKATQKKLDSLQNEISSASVMQRSLKDFANQASDWVGNLQKIQTPPSINRVAPLADDEIEKNEILKLASGIEKTFRELSNQVIDLHSRGTQQLETLEKLVDQTRKSKSNLDDMARALRKEIEAYAEGAGEISRDLGLLREKLALADDRTKQVAKLAEKYEQIIEDLRAAVRAIEAARLLVFKERKEAAERLSHNLAPTITVDVKHSARIATYDDALKDALRGSNLRYNEITPLIASSVSPEELIDMIKHSSFDDFAETLDIPVDRATRILHHLQHANLADILTAEVEDDVQFALLDGAQYKKPDQLSIGQRCTVSLTIVLENQLRALLVDQPEDHLDNEFIAQTLIKSLVRRSSESQTIVSSHNANIPVLANADHVICLNSNGRRGFVECSGGLDQPDVVTAIENIMEGGRAAFEKRVEFYGHEEGE